jgi:hypothetical protein
MGRRNKHVAAALALGLAVSALATPSFAQRSEGGAQRRGESGMSAAREKALRDCSGKAGKMSQSTWGAQQLAMHRTCMMEHGEPE